MWFLVLAVVISAFLINRSRIRGLQDDLEDLRMRMSNLETQEIDHVFSQSTFKEKGEAPQAPVAYGEAQKPPLKTVNTLLSHEADERFEVLENRTPVTSEQSSYTNSTQQKSNTSPVQFEQLFGGKAFVWMGGIALALAGFYFVKYSIENGLLSENIRVILSSLFGLALLYGGQQVRQHPEISDSTRISQALSGAGIAVLYGSFYAATNFYHLIPEWLGFVGMTVVTAGALLLSLLYGAPIAALGLLGGFATPLMIHGEPHAPLLFSYLLLLFGGLMAVVRQRGLWWLALPAVLISFGWTILWLVSSFAPADGIWLVLFLIGISAIIVMMDTDKSRDEDTIIMPSSWLRYVALGGSMLIMGAVTFKSDFSIFEWSMFGLFALAAYILAWAKESLYGFAPWLAMGANAVMILAWDHPDPFMISTVLSTMGFLHAGGSYYMMQRSRKPLSWAALSTTTTTAYYLIAYHKLDHALTISLSDYAWPSASEFWCAMAFGLSIMFTTIIQRLSVTMPEAKTRQNLQAVFACAVTALLSSGMAILLHQSYWPVALTAEIFAVSWLYTRTGMPFLLTLNGILMSAFGLIMIPDAIGLVYAIFAGPFENLDLFGERSLTFSTIFFRSGIPACMILTASSLLRDKKDDTLVELMEYAGITLFAITGYKAISLGFGSDRDLIFASQSCVTILCGGLALAAFYADRLFRRSMFERFAYLLSCLTALRILFFAVLFHSPLWTHQFVGEWRVLNYLLLGYGLPVALERFPIIRDSLSC